jgi:hypothetical protein
MDGFRLVAARKISEAMEEGAFDNLNGSGLPLNLEEDPFEDPAMRMAHRLLRNNGFAPRWVEEGKDLETAAVALRRELAEGRITREQYRARAIDLNRRILSYNIQTPSTSVHKPFLPESPAE